MKEDIWELDEQEAIKAVEEHKAKKVLLQLPDGLKPKAQELAKIIGEATGAEILVWAGSNYGACDLPIEAKNVGVDLIIHFGHSPWNYKRELVK